MSFPKYPEYKNSGVEWIGEIPTHWHCEPLKYSTEIYTGNSLNDEEKKKYESTDINHLPYISSKDIGVNTRAIDYENGLRIPSDSSGLKVAPKSSFVLCIEGGSAGKKIALLNQDVYFVNKLCCFNDKSGNLYKYFFAQSKNFKDKFEMSLTGLIGDVSTSALQNFCVPVPTPEEQISIGEFLNHETSKIDALISEQEKLIELLKEKRQAVISHAVTKGFDPNVKMKNSGIEWLGEVPEHWEIKKSSHLFQAKKGVNAAELTKEYCATIEGEYPVFSGQTENNGVMSSINSYEFDSGEEGYLFSTTVGAKAMTVSHIKGKFSLSQNCMVIIPKYLDIDTRFYYYHLQPLFVFERSLIPDHIQPSFRMEDLYSYKLAMPPLAEQREIASFLDSHGSSLSKLIKESTKSIELLQERRSALISAAVTGQIDVREAL